LDEAVRIVRRLSRRRAFTVSPGGGPCLRQALALYFVLAREGHPARIHLGVRKDGAKLLAHSWVTLAGKPVGERGRPDAFTEIFTYPSAGVAPFAAQSGSQQE
jgi:hypothetical protein